MNVQSFTQVAARYRVILYDAFGVLRDKDGMLDGVAEAVSSVRAKGVKDYVLTNDASYSPQQLTAAYRMGDGRPLFAAEQIISSGLLAADHLARMGLTSGVAYLGPASARWYLERAGVQSCPLLEFEGVPRALVWLDSDGFDWREGLNCATNVLLRHDIPSVVANPDLSFPSGAEQVELAVGSLAGAVEGATKRSFVRYGKPGVEMFGWALRKATHALTDLVAEEVLMVGDTMETDIAGAAAAGFDSFLVLSGNTRADQLDRLLSASPLLPTYLGSSLAS